MGLVAKLASMGACLGLVLGVMACDVIMPPPPPPGPVSIGPKDFVWAKLDILRSTFKGVARLDCPKISSTLTATGICHPIHTPLGTGLFCPLSAPAESMTFYCITMDKVPAIYVDVRYVSTAKDIDFSSILGACDVKADGPEAGKAARYLTDKGYKACLFDAATVACKSGLQALEGVSRPIGLYLDLTGNPLTDARIDGPVDGPLGLVLDARLLDEDERQKAFESVFKLFSLLRDAN